MDIATLRRHWETWGNIDPFWAIDSKPENKGGNCNTVDFFLRGERWVAALMRQLCRLQLNVARERALDFGCGAGRLTQAFSEYFEECYGVDIAASMINLAERSNQYRDRCRYFLNRMPDLALFEDKQFDLVSTWIVLQHLQPQYIKSYLREFLRVLRPGGVLFFQLPADYVPVGVELAARASITSAFGELSAGAFHAEIRMINCPIVLLAGSQMILQLNVKNVSAATWPVLGTRSGQYQTKLGTRWRDAAGSIYSDDGSRTLLPADIAPGAEIQLPVLLSAPTRPGYYTLEPDVIQEGVGWFSDRGSPSLTGAVRVVSRVEGPAEQQEEFTPEIQMHSVPRPSVIALLHEGGAEVVSVRADKAPGAHFLSYSYIALNRREA